MSGIPLLTVIIGWPALAALLALAMGLVTPADGRAAHRWLTIASLVELGLCLLAIGPVLAAGGGYALSQSVTWVPYLGIGYHVGVDGVSLVLILLTALIGAVVPFICQDLQVRHAQFAALILFAQAATMGIFLSLDLILFYVFWEVVLIPLYLLVVGWGGPGRKAAAMKFLVMSLVGSLFMLVGIAGLGSLSVAATGTFTFDLPTLLAAHPLLSGLAGYLAFFAFALAFAVKSPLFPFHAWLPDTYTEAPMPVTVILSSVVSKAGVYAMLRFLLPLFPGLSAQFADLFIVLGVAGVLYGGVIALTQTDMKRLLAYVSLSHMGLMVAGVFALNAMASEGVVLQMVSHGVVLGAAFAFVAMLEARVGSRDLTAFGGLMTRAPVLAGFGMLVALAALGLPGLSSFAGEFVVLVGLFQHSAVLASIAAITVVLAAAYILRLYQGTMHGKAAGLTTAGAGPVRMRPRDFAVLVPLLAVTVYLGIRPGWVPARVAPDLKHISVPSAQKATGPGGQALGTGKGAHA